MLSRVLSIRTQSPFVPAAPRSPTLPRPIRALSSQFNRREVERCPKDGRIDESFLDAFKYLLKAIVHEIEPAV